MKPTTTQKLLTAVVVLQGAIIAGQWFGSTPAYAARNELNLPDPGARQLAMIDELKALNAKVDKLHTAITSGQVRVKVEKEEK